MFKTIQRLLLVSFAVCVYTGAVAGLLAWKHGTYQFSVVETDRLAPTANKGALVIASKTNYGSLTMGKIILYKHRGTLGVGKVVDTNRGIRIMSANTESAKSLKLSRENVVGEQRMTLPFAGTALQFISRPVAMVAVVYLPAMMLILAELKRLLRHYGYKPYNLNRYLYR